MRALGELGDAKARGALRERLEHDLDARVRRRIREVLRDLGEPKRAADTLREELDKLQGEHAELKTRLAKLEASQSDRRARGRGRQGEGPRTEDPAKKGPKK